MHSRVRQEGDVIHDMRVGTYQAEGQVDGERMIFVAYTLTMILVLK